MKIITATALLLLTAGFAPAAEPAKELPSAFRGVAFDQRLDAQVPLDIVFRDESGHEAALADYVKDRPVILVLVQYRCPMLCTQVLNSLVKSLRGVAFDIGTDYEVVTVSFDAREKPELAAAKKQHCVESFGRAGAEQGWHFLTGDQPSIDRLTQAVGFRYRYDAATDQFAHASGIMLLTPQGKVSRYFYGLSYHPRDVRLGLVEASRGVVGTPVDQVLLLCFRYDPAQGKYTAAVMNGVRAGGALTLLVLGGFMGFHWLRDWRRGRIGRNPAPQQG
jgi:protein SCO1/2